MSTEPETVYAHVERTVHRLLDRIESLSLGSNGEQAAQFAAAVRDLSAWPQFNPMNAHDDYRKLAEYEVERAMRARLDGLRDVADELEKKLHAAVSR